MKATSLLPVINSRGHVVGHAATTAHKKASALACSTGVRQEFRTVAGSRRLCWIAV